MHQLNNILSLPVLSLYEGELVGQISKIYFDKKLKKVESLTISGEGEINFCLKPRNIYKLGKNAITIKNTNCLSLEDENDFSNIIPTPLDSKTYTIQGEYIGKINQITIDDKFRVSQISLDNNTLIDNNKLASCSKNTVIIYDESTKVNVSRFKNVFAPKLFKSNQTKNTTILPLPPTMEEVNQTNSANKSNNPKFLLGRIATQDIFIDEKKVLIKSGSTITERVLSYAYANNKIKELMLYSKQK